MHTRHGPLAQWLRRLFVRKRTLRLTDLDVILGGKVRGRPRVLSTSNAMLDLLLYPALRAGSRIVHWYGRRLTPAGRLAAAALVGAAVWGVDTNLSMAFQAFTFLLAMLLLSLGASLVSRPKLRVSRQLPRFGTAGEPFSYGLRVENRGGGVLRGLTLREELKDPRPTLAEFRSCKDPRDGRYHWVERRLGYSRWRRIVRLREASLGDVAVPNLPAGASCTVQASLLAPRRGRLALAGVSVGTPDPLGLAFAWRRQPAEESVLILPKRYRVPRLELPGARRYQQGGVALASSVGDSQEFMSLRDYRPGDPLRRIHWKSWAKTGRPIVKENHDEYFVRHALALDTFSDDGGPAFEEAVSVAASFACSVLTQESLLDLLFVGSEAYCVTAGRGLAGADRLLEVLASASPCAGRPFSELSAAVTRRAAALSGCIAVLLAWDEERRAMVRGLRTSGVPVLALVVLPEGAAAPAAPPDGPVRFLQAGRIAAGLGGLK